MDPGAGWPTPPARRTVGRIKVGDKRWESRWKKILSALPKDCMPRSLHGEVNWTITDSDETTSIQIQAQETCFYIAKTKGTWKGSRRINVSKYFDGNFNKAGSDVKKATGWSGISKATN